MNSLDHAFYIARNLVTVSKRMSPLQASCLLAVKAGLDSAEDIAKAFNRKDCQVFGFALIQLKNKGYVQTDEDRIYYSVTKEGDNALLTLLNTRTL